MGNFFTKDFVLTFLLFLWVSAVNAQNIRQHVQITGSLVDENNKPIDFATVNLLSLPDSAVIRGAVTSETGTFAFVKIPPGNYVMRIINLGYQTINCKVLVISEKSSDIQLPVVQMHKLSRSLNTVNITATKPIIEQKTDRTIINVAGSVLATGNSALEILARAPGVSLDKDENISLKGKQGVTIMLNDKLTYLSPSQLTAFLRSTDGATIQSIEIISNPSAKYDAAGNSGIINIKLKKSSQRGTNGSVIIGASYGNNGSDNTTVSLYHKTSRLSVFGTFSHNDIKRDHNVDIKRIVKDTVGVNTYFDQLSTLPHINHNNSYRFGTEYEMIPKNTIGFLTSGYFNKEFDDNTSLTTIGAKPGKIDAYQRTVSQVQQTFKNFTFNLQDRFKIDTSGQQLNLDIDYSKFTNNSYAQFETDYYSPDGKTLLPAVLLRNQSPSTITIHSGKLDHVYSFAKKFKLESGIKISEVKTINDLNAQKQLNGNYANDTTLTNSFGYTEIIKAAYLNLSRSFKKTSVQIGLRSEHTNSKGELFMKNQIVQRSYLDIFPSISINHTLNDKIEISISYGRRIDRPNYDDLNPFIYYIDAFTSLKGNPFLKPQYTNNFALNYSYAKTVNLSIGFNHTTDMITELLLTNQLTKATVQTYQNLKKQKYYNINLNTPFTINDWWTGNANATVFYSIINADSLLGARLSNGKVAFQSQLTQSFRLGKNTRTEFMTRYESLYNYGIYLIKYHYSNDIGISHSFNDRKFDLKFSINDVFNTRRDDVISKYQTNNIDIRQKLETRVARLTFTCNFGNNSIRELTNQSSADDLQDRIKAKS